MEKAATELRAKIKKLKNQRIVEMQCAGTERIINSQKDQAMLYINGAPSHLVLLSPRDSNFNFLCCFPLSTGLSDDDRCHLQEYLADL